MKRYKMIERITAWYSYEVYAESEEDAYNICSSIAENYELMEEQHEETMIEDVEDLSKCKHDGSKGYNSKTGYRTCFHCGIDLKEI